MENESSSARPSAFGSLLRSYRLAAGLSQEALAERARISAQGIGALERGDRRTPQRETLTLLADALGLNSEQRFSFEAAAVRKSVPRPGKSAVSEAPRPQSRPALLPPALTSFVGREAEIAEIGALVRERRLITLTGPGGIGKTRTALEVGAAFAEHLSAGVRLVELAPLGDSEFVAAAIAAALELQEVPNQPPLTTLLAYLHEKELLLLLDNCEHVVSEAALVAERLLRGCPRLRILATSREPLRVAGEQTYRLPALAAPALEAARKLGVADAAGFPSIVLFTQRAQAVDHRFALSDETVRHVAEICARLDGIPLAIELAAARVTSLPVAAIAEKLDLRFALLAHGGRTAPARQQTLRATIDWSYELLSQPERRIFECLSVFAGGCTLEAATAVCGEEGAAESDVLELLSSLTEKSLIVAEMNLAGPRYRLLESFRQYGREKLVLRADRAEVCSRHALTYCRIAEYFERAFQEVPDRGWHASARLELDNWRTALEWSLGAANDICLGQRLTASLKSVWQRFAISEGRIWIRLGLELVDENTPLEVAAELDRADAAISEELGEFSTSLAAALRAVDRYHAIGDRIGTARSQVAAGSALVRLDRPSDAEPLLREALGAARALGLDTLAANTLYLLAAAGALSGDFAEARAASGEALAMYRALGKERWVAVTLTARAEIEFWAGDAEAAVRVANEALAACRFEDDPDSVESAVHANTAAYLIAIDRYDEARTHAREALDISRRLRFELHETWALQHLAAIAALAPQTALMELPRAARLIGFVGARYAALGAAPEPTDRQEYNRVLAALRAAMPWNQLDLLLARGAEMSEEQAIEEALRVEV